MTYSELPVTAAEDEAMEQIDTKEVERVARLNVQYAKRLYIVAKGKRADAETVLAPLEEELKSRLEVVADEHRETHREAYQAYADTLLAENTAEAELRRLTIDYYEKTKTKTVDENLSVRVNTKLEYEIGKAVEWAKENAPVMIVESVDKKSFEALPAVKKLDFVFEIETPTAVISGIK